MFIKKDLLGLFHPDTNETPIDWLETQFIAAGWTIDKKVQTTISGITNITALGQRWTESSMMTPYTNYYNGSHIHCGRGVYINSSSYVYWHGVFTYTFDRPQPITNVTLSEGGTSYGLVKLVGYTRDVPEGYHVIYDGATAKVFNISTGYNYDGIYWTTGNYAFWYAILSITTAAFDFTLSNELYVHSPNGDYMSFALEDASGSNDFDQLAVYSNSGFDTGLAVDAQPGTITGVGGNAFIRHTLTDIAKLDMAIYIEDSYFHLLYTRTIYSGTTTYDNTELISAGTLNKYGTYTGGRYLTTGPGGMAAVEYEGTFYTTDDTLADQMGLAFDLTALTGPTKYRNAMTQASRLQPTRLFIDTSLTETPIYYAVGEIPNLYYSKKAHTHGGVLYNGVNTFDVHTSDDYASTENWIVQTS